VTWLGMGVRGGWVQRKAEVSWERRWVFGEEGWGVEVVLVVKEGVRGFRVNGLEGGGVDGVVGLSDEWKYWKRLCLIASTDDLDHCKAVTGYSATLAR